MKNVLITAMLALMLALAPNVFAMGGGEGGNHNCQGEGNENSPCDGEGGEGGGGEGGGGNPGGGGGNIVDLLNQQQQGFVVGDIGGGDQITGDVTNRLNNDSESNSSLYRSGNSDVDNDIGNGFGNFSPDASADSTNRNRNVNGDVSGSNTLIIGGSENEEGSTLSPIATSNQSLAGGDQVSTQTTTVDGNNSTVVVNIDGMSEETARALGQPDITEVTVDARDLSNESLEIDARTTITDNSVYEAPEMSANSAATTFASICTSGASGQGRGFGASISVTSDQCANLMQADAYMALGMRDEAIKYVNKAARHVNNKGFLGHIRHVLTLGIL